MEIRKVIALASILAISLSTACAKKSVQPIAYPSVNNTSQTVGDTQNYLPYDQNTQTNQSYYGNDTQLSDDTSSFDNSTSSTSTDTSTNTNQNTVNLQDLYNDIDGIGNIPDLQPYNPNTSNNPAASFTLVDNYIVDQDKYLPSSVPLIGNLAPDRNQWQAVGVALSGSTLYISAYDKSGLFKKGTVITMDASSGKNWKDLGSTLIVRHPMDATVLGLAVDSSNNIYAADSTSILYSLKSPKYSVLKPKVGFSSVDVAISNGNVIISTSSGLKKLDTSLSNPMDFGSGISSSSGIGADNSGNIYVVSGNEIKKVTPTGTVTTTVKDAKGAIDVASNGTNIYALTTSGVDVYDNKGKLLGSFGQGESLNPQAIACNDKTVFVADSGSSQKDSQILVYSNMSL